MDIPDLVERKLGDEEIQAGVSLGDEDAVCLTPTRTLVYRGDGLLSDEQVEEFAHDVERVAVSEGRRKTKFTLQYIDGTKSFTVPGNRGEKVLELFLEGVLRVEEVIDARESVVGVFRFSELTVIITEGRLIKHIGEHVWDDDYEVYPYEDVTSLAFERASVATSISLSVDGRPQRVKVPNDQAPMVRQTLEKALFAFYDVGSLEELNRTAGDAEPDGPGSDDAEDDDGFEFGDDFDPLVSEDDEDELTESVDTDDALGERDADPDAVDEAHVAAGSSPDSTVESATTDDPDASATDSPPPIDAATADDSATAGDAAERDDSDAQGDAAAAGDGGGTADEAQAAARANDAPSESTPAPERSVTMTDAPADGDAPDPIDREEFDAMADRLDDLTEAVERQNELLRRQHRAIKQLVKQQSDD